MESVEAGGHVVITKHGREVAMLISIAEGRQLHPEPAEPNFVEYLMTIPCEIPLDDADRPRIADVHVFDEPRTPRPNELPRRHVRLVGIRPGRAAIAPDRLAWALSNQHRWFLPTVAAMELRQGVCKLERLGASRRAADLDRWFRGMLDLFAKRVVGLDLATALEAAGMSDRLIGQGCHPGFGDVLIAASARARGFAVLTRNLRHFEPTGVPAFDPFSADPARQPI